MFKAIASILFGAAVGVSGVFLHNGYRPFGLIASLIGLLLGAYLIREMYRSWSMSWLYLIGWALVILRASTLGNGGELLIEANFYVNTLVLGGSILIFGFTLRAKKSS